MKSTQLRQLSLVCFFPGFASILASIAIWFLTGGTAPELQAHAERFGIFVGLWAPTFFILSNRFDRYSALVPKVPLSFPKLAQRFGNGWVRRNSVSVAGG
jgi:hypothetical protein